jgi:hypothetical protein
MQTQKCKTCKIIKLLSDFHKDRSYKGGYGYRCKKCACEYQKRYNKTYRTIVTEKSRIKRQKIKEILVNEHGGKCHICGYSKYNGALNFHHRDPFQKDFHVTSTGIHKARMEAEKCILVCANCHMEIHGGVTFIT